MKNLIVLLNQRRYKFMLPILVLLLALSSWSSSAFGQATVMTDKADYFPGETVIITGSGFLGNETINLMIEHLEFEHVTQFFTASADGSGDFTSTDYVIDPSDLGETFRLTATGASSGLVAIATFTDGNFLGSIEVGAQEGYFIPGVGGTSTFPIIVTRDIRAGNGNFDVRVCISHNFPTYMSLSFSLESTVIPDQGIVHFNTGQDEAVGEMTVTYNGDTPVDEDQIWGFWISGYVLPNNNNTNYNCENPTNDNASGSFEGTLAFGYAPSISCPSPIVEVTSKDGDIGDCGAFISYDLTYISDDETPLTPGTFNGYPEPSIEFSMAGPTGPWISGSGSGGYFEKGITTVWLKAENSIDQGVCSFTIEIIDDEVPELTGTPFSDQTVYNGCMSEAELIVPEWTEANAILGYTDNCPPPISATLTGTSVTGTDCDWTLTYTCTVFDAVGNPLPDQAYVHNGKDQDAPHVEGPTFVDDILYNSCMNEALETVPPWDEGNALMGYADDCGGLLTATLSNTEVTGDDCDWTVTYTYSVFDKCKNELPDQTYVHNGKDQDAPHVEGPTFVDDILYNSCMNEALETVPPWDEGNALMGYADDCGGLLTATLSNSEVTGDDCDWTVTYTYSVFDKCKNELPDQAYVHNGKDQDAPHVEGPTFVDDILYNSCINEALEAVPPWDEGNALMGYADDCGGLLTATLSNTEVTGDDCDWTVTYTYSVFDKCKNELTDQTYVHNGKDQDAPHVEGPTFVDDILYNSCMNEALETVPPWDEGNALMGYADDCGGLLTATLSNTEVTGDDCDWTVTYTYSVFDKCKNELPDQAYVHNGKDQDAPHVEGPTFVDDILYNSCMNEALEAVPPWDEGNALMGYADDCGGLLTATLSNTEVTGDDCDWTVTYTYSVFDKCKNELPDQTYVHNGKDQDAPHVEGPTFVDDILYNSCMNEALETVPPWDEGNALMGYADDCGGLLTATLSNTEVTGDDCDWTVTYTYSVFDKCKNELPDQTYDHNGKDQDAPHVEGPTFVDDILYNSCMNEALEAVPPWDEGNALMGYADDCGGLLTATLSNTEVTGDDCDWTVTYTYSVFDKCKNELPDQAYVHNGKDQDAPHVEGPTFVDDILYNSCMNEALEAVPPWDEGNALMGYADDCGGLLTATLSNTEVTGDDCDWTVTYTYSVFDKCKNELTDQTYVHNGKDQDAPHVEGPTFVDDILYNSCMNEALETVPPWDEGNALMGYADDCGGLLTATLSNTEVTGDDCDWTVTYTYSVFDKCKNELPDQAYVHNGKDQDAPTLTDPGSVFVDPTDYDACMDDAESVVPPFDQANAILGFSDNCGGIITASLTETETTGTNCDWVVVYTYTVYDLCMNPLSDQTYSHSGSDQTPPVVITKDIVVELLPDGRVTIPDDAVDNGSYDECGGSLTFSLSQIEFSCDHLGPNLVTLTVTDECANSASETATVTIVSPTVTTALVSAEAARHMDEVTLYAEIEAYCDITGLTGDVEFFLDGVSVGSAPAYPIPYGEDGYGTKLRASLIHKITQIPKDDYENVPWIVGAEFSPTTLYYVGSDDETELLIFPRDVDPFDTDDGFYTGTILAWTTGPRSSTGTITMVAMLKDNNDPVGDLRGAKVTFCYVEDGELRPIPSAKNLPVGLVDMTDGTIGVASADVQVDIGKADDAASFKIAILVTGGYINDPTAAESQATVKLAKPVSNGKISGTGTLRNRTSDGQIKGAFDEITSFDFDVEYNKRNTNPQGEMSVVVQSYYTPDGLLDNSMHMYVIKSNAINLMVVGINEGLTQDQAIFDGKANLSELLLDGTSVSIDGNSPFHVTMTDGGNTPEEDLIAITYYNRNGGIWFSSSFNWANPGDEVTLEQALETGEIVVGTETVAVGKKKKDGEIADGQIVIPTSLTVYPNPTSGPVTFEFTVKDDGNTSIDIYSATGQLVQRAYAGFAKAGEIQRVSIDRKLARGMYFVQLRTREELVTTRLIVGNRYE